MIYFNDNEPFVCEWLRNLYPESVVDESDIESISSQNLQAFNQCHFFAGVGGWRYALELAGWPWWRKVWSGSCPCQPFSIAGEGKGTDDRRHAWPSFRKLIRKYLPATIFGEQVASPDGRRWLARVRFDLEEMGYAVGAADLCAASVAAPHARQRLFWVANAKAPGPQISGQCGTLEKEEIRRSRLQRFEQRAGDGKKLADSVGFVQRTGSNVEGFEGSIRGRDSNRPVVNNDSPGPQGHDRDENRSDQPGRLKENPFRSDRYTIVDCLDGKRRRVPCPESGIQPLAYGIPRAMGKGRAKNEKLVISSARTSRIGQIKGYGNAIVPELAAEFIRAFLETESS